MTKYGPGTVGGAVRGNAGCYGVEVADRLACATLLNITTGELHTEDAAYFDFGYRQSWLKQQREIVVSATFRLAPADTDTLSKITEIAQLRASKQPRFATAGSFFKNPVLTDALRARLPRELQQAERIGSWQLTDAVGLRGYRVGDAEVSEQHANYIINRGHAKATDVVAVAEKVEAEVYARFGVRLEREVEVIG